MLTILVVSWVVWAVLFLLVGLAGGAGNEGMLLLSISLVGSGFLLAIYSIVYLLYWLSQHLHWS